MHGSTKLKFSPEGTCRACFYPQDGGRTFLQKSVYFYQTVSLPRQSKNSAFILFPLYSGILLYLRTPNTNTISVFTLNITFSSRTRYLPHKPWYNTEIDKIYGLYLSYLFRLSVSCFISSFNWSTFRDFSTCSRSWAALFNFASIRTSLLADKST